MARRVITHRPECAEPECRERALFEYDTRREADASYRSLAQRPWRCTRHTQPQEVLSPTNPVRRTVLTASKSPRYPHLPDLFWIAPGEEGGSGFTYGPGFKAFARDWPEGTRIEVTARVLPDDEAAP